MVKKANQPAGIIRKGEESRAGSTGSQRGCPLPAACAWHGCPACRRCWSRRGGDAAAVEGSEKGIGAVGGPRDIRVRNGCASQSPSAWKREDGGSGAEVRWGRLSTLSSHTRAEQEVTTCQLESKPNGVILLNHGALLPRMLHTADFEMVSRSCQRNWWKKTTVRMTDYKDSESGAGVLCQEEGDLHSSILWEGWCSLESTSGWVKPCQGW